MLEYENRLKIDYVLTDPATGETMTKAHTDPGGGRRATNELCFESPAVLTERVRRFL